MSPASKRPCVHPGCAAFASRGGRCEQHQREHQRKKDAADRIRQSNPNTATREREFYISRKWRLARRIYLQAHPLCVDCQREGKPPRLAEELDHITPLRDGGPPFAWSNLAGRCKSHHSAKTMREVHERRP